MEVLCLHPEEKGFPPENAGKYILYYMNGDELCTVIYVDFRKETVRIENKTDDLLYRAFGCIEDPDWKDFLFMLEERCFPRTRDKMKSILRAMDLPFYDPWLIVQKTQGRMADDHQWIRIEEDNRDHTE